MKVVLSLGMLVAMAAAAQEPRLRWEEFHEPVYPQMARVANIWGAVTIEFTIGPDGTMAVQTTVGHPILVPAAMASVKLSKLTCGNCEQNAARFSVVFEFKIAKSECGNSSGSPRAVLEDTNHVTITTDQFCFVDPGPELTKKVRSIRCLYLWKCAVRRD